MTPACALVLAGWLPTAGGWVDAAGNGAVYRLRAALAKQRKRDERAMAVAKEGA